MSGKNNGNGKSSGFGSYRNTLSGANLSPIGGAGPSNTQGGQAGGAAPSPVDHLVQRPTDTRHIPILPEHIALPLKDRLSHTEWALNSICAQQGVINDTNVARANQLQAEVEHCNKTIVTIQREICARSCVVKGVPGAREAKEENRGGRKVWTMREAPHETMAIIRTKVLPILGLDAVQVQIEACTRFPQNSRTNKASGVRIRFCTLEDRHKIFSQLSKLRNDPLGRSLHFMPDYPSHLQDLVRRAEFASAELRAREKDLNTMVYVERQFARVQYRKKGSRGKWTTMTDADYKAICDDIQSGRTTLENKAGQALMKATADKPSHSESNLDMTIGPAGPAGPAGPLSPSDALAALHNMSTADAGPSGVNLNSSKSILSQPKLSDWADRVDQSEMDTNNTN